MWLEGVYRACLCVYCVHLSHLTKNIASFCRAMSEGVPILSFNPLLNRIYPHSKTHFTYTTKTNNSSFSLFSFYFYIIRNTMPL